jgi:hypothetical protein
MKNHPSYGYATPEEIDRLKSLGPTDTAKREEILSLIRRRTARANKKAQTTITFGGKT